MAGFQGQKPDRTGFLEFLKNYSSLTEYLWFRRKEWSLGGKNNSTPPPPHPPERKRSDSEAAGWTFQWWRFEARGECGPEDGRTKLEVGNFWWSGFRGELNVKLLYLAFEEVIFDELLQVLSLSHSPFSFCFSFLPQHFGEGLVIQIWMLWKK